MFLLNSSFFLFRWSFNLVKNQNYTMATADSDSSDCEEGGPVICLIPQIANFFFVTNSQSSLTCVVRSKLTVVFVEVPSLGISCCFKPDLNLFSAFVLEKILDREGLFGSSTHFNFPSKWKQTIRNLLVEQQEHFLVWLLWQRNFV